MKAIKSAALSTLLVASTLVSQNEIYINGARFQEQRRLTTNYGS